MGIIRASMRFVLPIFIALAVPAIVRWPVPTPSLWRVVWGFSAVVVVVATIASFLLVIRSMRLQVAHKTRELWEKDGFLANLMNTLPGMAYRRGIDRDGTLEIVSEGGITLTGYPPVEMVRFRDLVHPEDQALAFPEEGEEVGRGFRRRYRLQTKAGGTKWVIDQGVGVAGSDESLSSVEGFLLDVTEQVAAHEALRQSREKYRAIFDSTAEGIFQLAADGSLLAANRALAEIFGYPSPKEMIAAVNGDGQRFLERTVQDELLSRVNDHQTVEGLEIEFHRNDGTRVSLSINARGLQDGEGGIRRIEGVIEDVTGKKETERLRIEREMAETASKTKSDFLASIGHEIRTPLNSILGFSEILQAQLRDERLQQYIQAISASGKTLLRLINDLLDLSKIEAGKFELQPSAVDLRRVSREIELVFMPSVDEKQLEFVVELDPLLPKTVFLDEVRLRQILINLLRNAFKFTDKGRISLSLKVGAGNSGPAAIDLEIAVSDTGIGIPPEELETIFDAFVQRRRQNQAKYAGTGLGLSITRRLVEILGGTISLDSEVGKGSIFTAVLRGLPVADDQFDQSEGSGRSQDIRFDEEAVVLVVDAMDGDRLLIREFLRSTKLAVVETISIAEGVEWCNAIRPDIILLDYTLCALPDAALVQRFNHVKEELNIPTVVMTSATGVGSDAFYSDYRFDGWLGKPLLFDDVMSMLARFLPHATLGRYEESRADDRRREYSLPTLAEVRLAMAGMDDRLPVLRRTLAGNLLVQWQEIQETCIINEMKSFAEEIERLSEEYHLEFLAVWAKALLGRIRLFDMERVPEIFDSFPGLIESIEMCGRPEPECGKPESNNEASICLSI